MGRWTYRRLSPTTWFYVACSCCTGVLYTKQAQDRAKQRSCSVAPSVSGKGSSEWDSTIEVTSIDSSLGSSGPRQQHGQQAPFGKREFVSSQMSMWMDVSIPLDVLHANRAARVILLLLNAVGWASWACMIFLAFYYQFFTLHDRQFSYLSLPLLISCVCNAAVLMLAFCATLSKPLYRTPFLLSISALGTMLLTTICAFLVENDELFFAGCGMASVQLVYWVAFTTGYGAVVSPWLHPFVPCDREADKDPLRSANV